MPHHILKDYSTTKDNPICLHENKFFKMMFNGYFHYLEGVRFNQAIATVPFFENGDLLMVKLRRAPQIGFSLEFPRGGVDINESLTAATMRELKEETGYSVDSKDLTYLGKVAPDTATLNYTIDVYKIIIPDHIIQGDYDNQEIEQPVRISVQEFKEKVRNGEIIDGITLACWTLSTVILTDG